VKIVAFPPKRDRERFAVTFVLELSSRGWRGITMTPRAVAEIERLRRGPPTEKNEPLTEEVIAA
jgi:hypothetical protein